MALQYNTNNKNNNNIDYHKAFDSVSHSWLIHILQIYKIDSQIINSLQQLMKKWTTALKVKLKNHRIMSDPIRVRGILVWQYMCVATRCGNKETGLLLLLISDHVDDEEEGRALTRRLPSTVTQRFIHAHRLVWP